jgi:hypothetical protein
MLRLPRVAYNMAAAACRLEDISDTPDPKTNERLHEAKQLLHIALEQQAESSVPWHRVATSRLFQPMPTVNRDYSDTHAPPTGGDSDDASGNNFDRLRTRGAKP